MIPPTRDRAWIEREYGREKWAQTESYLDDLLAEGEYDLGRVINILTRMELPINGTSEHEAAAHGRPCQIPSIMAWLGERNLVYEILRASCPPDCTDVVELASGWGRNLFGLWLQGGPRSARYWGLELTETGRRCQSRLAALAPDLAFESAFIDLQDPVSLPSFPGADRQLFLFSHFGLHQVTELSSAVIEALLDNPAKISGAFLEPIGFQIAPTTPDLRLGYAARNGYNRNLWVIMRWLEQQGRINIVRVEPDLFGTKILNPWSLICWTKSS